MTVAEKKELVRFLKRGDKKLVCKMAGVHETVMYAWISDRLKTSSIEPYVIQLVNQRKREFEEMTGVSTDLTENELMRDNPAVYQTSPKENQFLKDEIESRQVEIKKYRKLISGKNRIYRELFIKLSDFINRSDLKEAQKSVMIAELRQFQSDHSFLNHYERYANILSTINPLLSESLDKLNIYLTPHEKRIIALIKLNLSSHEIAVILAVSAETIEKRSLVLKQKLKLDSEEDLADFINSL